MKKPKTAIVAGHICLDMLPQMDHLPEGLFESSFQPGQLVSVGDALLATGGPVSNVGLALHKLGIRTHLIAKTGNDPFGRLIQQIIAGFDPGLLDGLRVDEIHPTSYTIIISPPGVDRIFLHCPGVNDAFKAKDIDLNLVAEADIMHFGYPPIMQEMYKADGAELVKIFREAKRTGITTSLDMSFPDPACPGGQADWRVILADVLPLVDIFTPSVEEILFMLHRPRFDEMVSKFGDVLSGLTPELLSELSAELVEMGTKMVLLKLGHQGAYLRTANRRELEGFGRAAPSQLGIWTAQELWSSCYQVDVVGTTGSGDATIAGFLGALLRDFPPRKALDAAVAVGACNVEAADALSGLCSLEATMTRVQRGWAKHDLDLQDSEGWVWDQENALWAFND